MLKIVFMGTPDFAVPCLEKIIVDGYDVCGGFTQPDKPKGRGYELAYPPVKEYALKYNIPVYQPSSLKDGTALELLLGLSPDLIVVVAYGKILPPQILNLPPLGCINVHASLLPKYRGAAPIYWSIMNGETETGITTMYMDVGLDTGDMILKAVTPIGETETTGELHDRLSIMGADLLSDTIKQLGKGTAPREKQDDTKSSYAPMLTKTTEHIDWSRSSSEIINQIRGLNPYPAAYTALKDIMLKIYKAEFGNKTVLVYGTVISTDSKGIEVSCGDGESIILTDIQASGGKRMPASVYLNGHPITIGQRLN
jgi:methionyl-tRNA formyltransferase